MLLRDVDEAVAAFVAIQNAALGARRLEMAGEGVLEGDVVFVAVARGRSGLGGIAADVDQQEIDAAIAVVVEEDRSRRRMADVAQAGGGGDVAEAALAVVLEQHVAAAHGGDVEIDVAVVVDVGEAAPTR